MLAVVDSKKLEVSFTDEYDSKTHDAHGGTDEYLFLGQKLNQNFTRCVRYALIDGQLIVPRHLWDIRDEVVVKTWNGNAAEKVVVLEKLGRDLMSVVLRFLTI